MGNSDGIGLAATRKLLERGWAVVGLSRSESPLKNPAYRHVVSDVQDRAFPETLGSVMEQGEPTDLCVYCAGIGEELNLSDMDREARIFGVNLLGMVKTATVVIPRMVERGRGHFIGLSSLADELLSAEAPSYHASKAGFSNYLEGLARAARPRGVHVTNLRFGFVDTKMAKGDVKPLMMSVERAGQHLLTCVERKPVRYTAPRAAIPLVKFRRVMMWLGLA
ncbi:MAG: SDR family NAD(P)-dependent oxidoreductase [Acidobacteriota bacterium]